MANTLQQNDFPFITVGIAFYNVEKTITTAIKSVLLQTYNNFELILIDDGSTDKSYEVAEKFCRYDDRIILVKGEKNLGVGRRLNQITGMATGEYIVRMDADDIMLPEKIEKQMKVLLSDKNLDLIDCCAYILNKEGQPLGKRKTNDLSGLSLRKILKSRTVFFHPTVIAKTSWFKKFPYDEDFRRGPDFELWCKSFGNTNFTRLEEPLFLYREGKVSTKNYDLNMESFRRSLKKYYKSNLSEMELKKEILISYVKNYMYKIFGFFGLQHLLTSSRNFNIDRAEREKIEQYITYINNFDVQKIHQ